MGREVRRVPKDWQHPKNEDGHYVPLFGSGFAVRDAEWQEGYEKWQQGLVRDYATNGWKPKPAEYGSARFSDYDGDRPNPDDYMPKWPAEQATHLMMYETCSEGTPISPAFETPEELARWLADNNASAFGRMGATYEQWLATCRGAWAPSMVIANGRMMSGVEAASQDDKGGQ